MPHVRNSHYKGKVECIEIIKDRGWLEGFCLGSCQKYLYRAGSKSGESQAEALFKAEDYLHFWRTGSWLTVPSAPTSQGTRLTK